MTDKQPQFNADRLVERLSVPFLLAVTSLDFFRLAVVAGDICDVMASVVASSLSITIFRVMMNDTSEEDK